MNRKKALLVLLLVVFLVLTSCLRGVSKPTPTPVDAPTPTPWMPPAEVTLIPPGLTPIPAPTTIGVSSNPFGIMLGTGMPLDMRMSVAKNLGVAFYRPGDIKVDVWKGDCLDCDAAQQAGFKLLLTLRNGGGLGQPSTFPADLKLYKVTVSKILDKYPGAMAVVENEENSSTLFYSGSPAQYHEELEAVCEVAHSKAMKCTNGGLVSAMVTLLVYNDYLEKGKQTAAEDFLRRAEPDKYQQIVSNPTTVQSQIEKGKTLISGYKAAGADYLNFHWYVADPRAFEEAVSYLGATSGLPVLSNEMGQQKNENPDEVISKMQKSVNLGLPVAVWFSIDVSGFGGAKGLQESDGSLRSNGEAFKKFITENYGGALRPDHK